MTTNRLDMKTLKQISCWVVALKTMASELSQPSLLSAAFRGQDPLENAARMLQIAESNFDSMSPEDRRSMMLDFAQKMGIEVLEDDA